MEKKFVSKIELSGIKISHQGLGVKPDAFTAPLDTRPPTANFVSVEHEIKRLMALEGLK